MVEKPILYKSPMVRAVQSDIKTNTRRVISRVNGIGQVTEFQPSDTPGYDWIMRDKRGLWNDLKHDDLLNRCPYGKPGDRLWVRETQRVIGIDFAYMMGNRVPYIQVKYEADGTLSNWIRYPDRLKGTPEIGKCLSYGGFRESSRIDLLIKDIRVERLQEISREGCNAEGCPREEWYQVDGGPEHWFKTLWNSINGKPHKTLGDISWAANPWVWVVVFERIKP